ncbi:hypothetical protein GCM10009754_12290 [Amycolatopsis minnesotensis]|uniref:Carrier domain-containing protein n=1 Tax=Amycolatopsis minnesotensis TaxID=337894 RepID=A0ABP5BMK7_9PSEU
MTGAQQGIWLAQRIEPDSPVYNVAGYVEIRGADVDLDRLSRAVRAAVDEAECVHVRFEDRDGTPYQVPAVHDWELPRIDLRGEPDPAAAAESWMLADVKRVADLAAGPVHAHALLTVADDKVLLYQRYHHLVMDGYGAFVVINRISERYLGEVPERQWRLTTLVEHDAEYHVSARHEEDRAYWHARFADRPEPARLVERSPAQPSKVDRQVTDLSGARTTTLHKAAADAGTRLSRLMIAAVAAYLHRATGSEDVVLGLPVTARLDQELREVPGMVSNVLPLRVRVRPSSTPAELLDDVACAIRDLVAHSRYRGETLARELGLTEGFRELVGPTVNFLAFESDLRFCDHDATNFYLNSGPINDLTIGVYERPRGKGMRIEFDADAAVAGPGELAVHQRRFLRVLDALVREPDQPVGRIELLEPDERELVLDRFGTSPYPSDEVSWPAAFEARARETPEKVAVVCEDERLTYAELDARANQLAHLLRGKGISREDVVGVALPRSADLVVALLGVLKAGAAYLPLDLDHPRERIAYMLSDAGAGVVVSATGLAGELPAADVVLLDTVDLSTQDSGPAGVHIPLDAAAYVIYTSGSTGKPKGVVVPHDGVGSLMATATERIGITRDSRVAQFASVGFDVTVWDLVMSLCVGGTVVVVPSERRVAGAALTSYLAEHRVTNMILPPSLVAALPADCELPEGGVLVVGTETVPAELIARWAERMRVVAAYGLTEASVNSTLWQAEPGWTGPVPIGEPDPNTRCRVLDSSLRPVAPGVEGELYVGGRGLARGYLGRPGLTAERFVADPFGEPGTKMYRTGDRAKWRRDGTLDFLGRADGQVKIRGYRIEPGEIESVLMRHDDIAQAAVVVLEDHRRVKRLVAYTVGAADAQQARAQVEAALPDYMVPSVVVRMDGPLPLTPNGKLDRKALPEPDWAGLAGRDRPRTPAERTLSALAAEVLGLPEVGIHDSFFELGGDSIVAIGLVTKARRAGLVITPREVFAHRTVAALAALAQDKVAVEHGPDDGTGVVVPTPIVRWLAAGTDPSEVDAFYQSTLVRVPAGLTFAGLAELLQALLDRHDLLRATLSGDWSLTVPEPGSVRASELIERASAVDQRQIDEAVRRLAPRDGRMLQAVWFETGHRLLLVAHHLVVDGVSWRILLDDLARAWDGAELAPVTTSFRRWAELLAATEPVGELPLWRRQVSTPDPVLGSGEPGRAAASLTVSLPAAKTAPLLTTVPAAVHGAVNDVLLTGLALAIRRWRGDDGPVLVDLEGHGREEELGEVDLSRTVGWFTSMFPVRLDPGDGSLDAALKSVKERLRSLPRNGIGYGLLDTDPVLRDAPAPQVLFNYLGRFSSQDKDFHPAPESDPLGAGIDPRMPLRHRLEINAVVRDTVDGPELSTTFGWPDGVLSQASVRALAQDWLDALASLAECGATGHSPSDFPLVALDQSEVDELDAAVPSLTDVVPATPLQEGLFFHALFDEAAADAYVMQQVIGLRGPVEENLLRRALQGVVDRHAPLRAGFRQRDDGTVFQVIGEAEVPWRVVSAVDVRAVAERDRGRRFDLAAPPLLSATFVRGGADRHWLVLTLHHLVSDGWSTPVLIGDLFALYGRDTAVLPGVTPYREYFGWLSARDRDAALAAWGSELAELEAPTLLAGGEADPARFRLEQVRLDLPVELTGRLTAVAREHHVTLSTVFQAAWGLVLGALTGRDDVVFGTTVSGRAAEVPGIEAMAGLFANTLPVRVRAPGAKTLGDVLTGVQAAQAELLDHQHVGLADLQRLAGFDELFDTLLVFENYPLDRALTDAAGTVAFDGLEFFGAGHYPLTLLVLPGDRIGIEFDHDASRLSERDVRQLAERLVRVLESVAASPGSRVAQLDVLSRQEHDRIDERAATAHAVPGRTLAQAIAAQVAKTPSATAVVFEGTELSYADLDGRADALAARLDAGPEDVVAVAVPRSADLVVALLAVLKTGAAYLPLDTGYPAERIEFMLTDSGARQVVVADAPVPVPDGAECVDVRAGRTGEPAVSLAVPDNPAYLIYTSGSTGRPKGVLVSHRAIVNRLAWMQGQYGLEPGDRVLQKTPSSFDVSVWEFFWPLVEGATVVLARPDGHRDPEYLADVIRREAITTTHFVPSMLAAFLREIDDPAFSSSLRRVFSSGEALPGATAARWLALTGVPLHNLYGPTEAAVDVSWFPCGDTEGASVPIGRPVWNTGLHVLDTALRPVPDGTPGELYLAGVQLARGYHGRAALTSERFVADPFGEAGTRMYRTGDLVFRRSDGVLEYLGRTDRQVKVRGNRIELGEIEAALVRQDGIAQAAVTVRENALVGYLVGTSTVDTAALSARLASVLPAPMVPGAFVVLDELPLTPSGKLDAKALPAPTATRAPAAQGQRTAADGVLAEIFGEVLGITEVAPSDDFFVLGGDSILSIAVTSRARKRGMKISPREVFEHRTPAALAALAGPAPSAPVVAAEDGVGEVPPLPIVHWLRERGGPIGRFSLSSLVRTPIGADVEALAAVLQALLDHHDALRLRLTVVGGAVWTLETRPAGAVSATDVLRGVSAVDDLRALVAEEAAAAADRLDPEAGIMVQAVFFDAGAGEPGRLLLVVHHLAIDGVSWRILSEDLAAAWDAVSRGAAPALEPVGTSMRAFAKAVTEQAHTRRRLDELAHWTETLAPGAELLPDHRGGGTFGSASRRVDRLSVAETKPLLSGDVTRKFLDALHVSVNRWRGRDGDLLVDLERHGREDVSGSDTARTVGWFTAIEPIRLGRDAPVPDGGISYGMLRYLNAQTAPLLASTSAQVLVNYLGRVPVGENGDWAAAGEAAVTGPDADLGLPYALQVDIVCEETADGPSLTASWLWPSGGLSEQDIAELGDGWLAALREQGSTEEAWPLSPLQEGLFFHASYDNAALDVYTVQDSFELGHRVDAARLRAAGAALLGRNPNLRAAFTSEGRGGPVQLISGGALEIPLDVIDLSTLPSGGQDAEVRRLLEADRARRFVLDAPPLCRMTLIRLGAARDRLVITHHLLLWDGWSEGVFLEQLFHLYERGGDDRGLPVPGSYRDYLDWLSEQDTGEAAAAWREALDGLEEPTLLGPASDEPSVPEQCRADLGAELSERLRSAARRHGLTINTVLNAAWALALADVVGRDDVVFGSTVAGRPAEIDDVDKIIGLFLNTIPVRIAFDPYEPVLDLLWCVQDQRVSLMAHEYYGLGEIQREAGHARLFDAIYVLQNFADEDAFDEFRHRYDITTSDSVDATHYPIGLVVTPAANLRVRLSYRPEIIDRALAEDLLGRFLVAVGLLSGDGAAKVGALDLRPHETLPAPVDRPIGDDTISDLLAAQALRTPDAVACVFGEQTVTYAELDARINRMARFLLSRGAEPEQVIALGLPRSIDMVVALFAVLRTGAAYLPLELDYPADRIALMLDDAKPLLVVDAELLSTVDLDGFSADPVGDAERPLFARDRADRMEHPAYVIYTSGSTGKPKGVVTPYRGLTNMQLNHQEAIFGPAIAAAGGRRLRIAHTVSFAFDMSWEELLWLVEGHEVHICDEELRRDAAALVAYCDARRIDVVNVTPTYAHLLFEEGMLRDDNGGHRPVLVLLGGEAVSESVWARLRDTDGVYGYNLYGPTEYTINTLGGGTEDSATPTVGREIWNTRAHVLDRWLRPVRDGVPGELYISGLGLARGYLHRHALTAERFVADPFGSPGTSMYRTGDLVRRRPDGNLDFLGRTDDQVKVRGYRVELGEIETVLSGHPLVARSAVIARDDPSAPGLKRLVGYVVPAEVDAGARAEVEAEQVGEWQQIYSDEYTEIPTALFEEDFAGWDSSYDGDPIPVEHMREWRAATVERITELSPVNVLEIGVGTGLLMSQLAPRAERYWGTDFAAPVIRKLGEELRRDPSLAAKVELRCRPADDLDGLPGGFFDTVVINSVIQYFPSAEYLAEVVTGAVELLAPGGALFVGDVRNLALLRRFHTAIQLGRGTPADRLESAVDRAVALEKELLLAPEFFTALADRLPGVGVEIRTKHARHHNELSRYRYDVVFHRSRESVVDLSAIPSVEWRQDLESLLGADAVRVTAIPDARLASEAPESGTGVEQDDVHALGERLGYRVRTTPSSVAGAFDAVFTRNEAELSTGLYRPLSEVAQSEVARSEVTQPEMARSEVEHANDPAAARSANTLAQRLRSDLKQRLPDYMVPGSIVLIDEIPLTDNGKLNVRALPDAEPTVSLAPSRPPSSAVEEKLCELFAEVLGLGEIGVEDNFFDLGGHSLLATRLISRARTELGTELAIRDLFDAPTVAKLAEKAGDGEPARPAVTARERPERIPLSPAQRRLLLLTKFDDGGIAYNFPLVFRLRGALDVDALHAALDDVVARHESLRTVFPSQDDEPYQRILDSAVVPFEVLSTVESALAERIEEVSRRPFDLTTEIPVRATVLRLGAEDFVVAVVLHHITTDEWSDRPFLTDLTVAYRSRVEGRAPSFAPLPVQYADYTLWQADLLGDSSTEDSLMAKELAFWCDRLAGAPDELALPVDRSRPARPSGRGGRVEAELSVETAKAVRALSTSSGASMFMLAHASVAVLLHRMGAGSDIVLGAPIAGRGDAEIADLVGFFVNTLVLRTDLGGDPTFGEVLDRVKEFDLAAFSHQDVPFDRVVEELNPPRVAGRNPLFQVLVGYHHRPESEHELLGLRTEWFGMDTGMAKFDLHFTVVDQPSADRVGLALEFATDLFDERTAALLLTRLERVLAQVASAPSRRVRDLDVLTETETAQVLDEWNVWGPAGPGLSVGWVDPGAVAVVCSGGELSFAEFEGWVCGVAAWLWGLGVGRGDRVGVVLPRSVELVVVVFAVRRVGAAYVPVDPGLPADRVEFVLADSAPRVVIDDVERVRSVSRDVSFEPVAVGPDDAAYVIYTSGSTGRPKGVVVPRAGMANRLAWMQDEFGLVPGDRVLLKTPASFDVSVWELFWPLMVGATLVIASPEGHRDPHYLAGLIQRERVDLVHFVPSMLEVFLAEPAAAACVSLRRVVCSGEALSASVAARFREVLPQASLHNLYGPTEASVDVTSWTCTGDEVGAVPIGRPIWNTQTYVLDHALNPVPPGVAGELYLAGVQLARGYLGRAGLTSERFVASPFIPGERLYRTGDLARWTFDGVLEFLGRVDHQVKIRGFRIELGEIETVLRAHPQVEQAAVVAHDGTLVAYPVPATVDLDDLRIHVSGVLPEYMVPTTFSPLNALPLTPNGKLDRAALPKPDYAGKAAGAAPRTEREEQLCAAFADVLGVERVGVDDDFFALGGHSLLVMRLVGRMRAELGIEVPLRAVFDAPTVAALAGTLGDTVPAAAPLTVRDRPERIPLSFAQRRLWVLDQVDGPGSTYTIPLAWRMSGALDLDALRAAVHDVVLRHESLRTVFPADGGEPYQQVRAEPEVPFAIERVGEDEVAAKLAQAADHAFALDRELPIRVTVLGTADDEHVVLLLVHHIAGDEWSSAPLAADLARAYASRVDGRVPEFAPLPVQYADYALWQRETLGDTLARQLGFWRAELAGLPDELALPTDRTRPAEASHRGASVSVPFTPELSQGLRDLARQHDVSLFMVLHAAVATLLTRLDAGTDVPIGSPISGRGDAALEDLVGFFLNTLVLRTDTGGDPTFGELLTRVRDTDLAAFSNQDVPFERLVDALNPERSLARHPLFQVMVVYLADPGDGLALPGISARPEPVGQRTAKFDLEFDFTDDGGRIEYSTDLFDERTAERLSEQLLRVLTAIVAEPGARIGSIGLLSEVDRQRMLVEWNVWGPAGPGLSVGWVDPGAVAVVCSGGELSFAEFEGWVCGVAAWLWGLGVGRGDRVGVVLPRSVELVVVVFAVRRVGAAYVPVDPGLPADRVEFVLADSAPRVVIDDVERVRSVSRDVSFEPVAVGPDDAAYVIYTSGSTGRPKGVVVPRAGMANRLAWMQDEFGLVPGDRVLLKTPASFDVSVWELFWPLMVGATLVIASPEGHRDPHYLAGLIQRERVDLVHFVPSMLEVFLAEPAAAACVSLRRVVCSGEALSASVAARFREVLPQASLHNLYGPTEASVDVTSWTCTGDEVGAVPIGRPIWNTQTYVLDHALNPVPPGVAGELYLAGVQLARGYLGRAGLTSERFVASPFAPGERLYRTGDLARWTFDGVLEFLGRVDHQVKIRGFRIELGEIETVLRAHPQVEQAAVVAHDGTLVAYPVPATVDLDDLRIHVSGVLPEYMVPTTFSPLNALPLTPNGKLDRAALPKPDYAELVTGGLPTTPREEVLCGLVAGVLGLDRVGVDDDFFALGGDSIVAMQLVARARAEGLALSPRDVFRHKTVAGLAAVASTHDTVTADPGTELVTLDEAERAEVSGDVLPVTPLQAGLLFHASMDTDGEDVYTVQVSFDLEGDVDAARLKEAAAALLDRHPNLRAGFRYLRSGRAVSVVPRAVTLPWREVALPGEQAWERALGQERRRFDPAEPPLIRFLLARVGDAYRFAVSHQHLLMDGWSVPQVMRELAELYQGGATAPVRYRDYLRWLSEQDTGAARAAWTRELEGFEEPTRLVPADPDRVAATPRRRTEFLDEDLTTRLTAFARTRGLTVNTLVQGAWGLLLGRFTGRDDVVFGATVSGRPGEVPGVESMIGLFINTVPVRVEAGDAETLGAVLDRLQERQAELMAHQHLGLADIQRAHGIGELFDTLVVFESYPGADAGPGAELRVTARDHDDATHYPFTWAVEPGERLRLTAEYRADLFTEPMIDRIVTGMRALFDAMVTGAGRKLSEVDVLSVAERRQVIESWNDTALEVPSSTVPALFEAQARRTPNAPALAFGRTQWTFAELDAWTNKVARRLIALGAGPETVVALSLPRSAEFLVAILAVHKAGAAYLPLDPDYPAERVSAMIEDCRPVVVLDELPDLAGADAGPVTDDDRLAPLHPDHPAYVIYTSGSTGRPKGVVVCHRGVANLFHSHRETLYRPAAVRTGRDRLRVAHAWSFSFDASWQPQLWLLDGHLLHVVDEETRRDPELLAGVLADERIDFVEVTPSYFTQMADAGLIRDGECSLAVVGVGGEAVPDTLWSQLRDLPGTEAYNLYGPTESTVDALVARVSETDRPLVGRPVANTSAYVLDAALRPVPPGVTGELYLAGAGLARGYLEKRALTAERFVANPYGPGRVYRTGDLARWTEDGRLDYLGRADDQVKIRGFRIELAEVEAALAAHVKAGQVLVVVREDRPGVKRLVAYVVPAEGTAPDPAELREHAGERLPEYMVPAAFVLLDAFPVLSNGKLDRKSLPAPDFSDVVSGRPPETERERVLATVFSAVLGVAEPGVDDDFFALGGDSIVAMQLVSRMRAAGLRITPRQVFAHRTVAALAEVAEESVTAQHLPADGTGTVALTPIMHALREHGGPIDGYHQVALVQTPAELGWDGARAVLAAVAARHDMLRARLVREGDWTFEVPETANSDDWIVHCAVSTEDDLHTVIAGQAPAARDRLDPDAGRMVSAVFFDAGRDRPGRLLVLIHHLVVDGVSWRILLPDFAAAWADIAAGRPPELTPVDTSFRRWSSELAVRAAEPARLDELPWWRAVLSGGDPLPLRAELDPARDVVRTVRGVGLTLPTERTEPLLTTVPAAFGVTVNDVLLTAFALAVADWRRREGGTGNAVLVDLEGHGREEELAAHADLSRTVGWFTSVIPVLLDPGEIDLDDALAGGPAAGEAIRRVAAHLAGMPSAGVGAGLLRHLNPDTKPELAALGSPKIEFNYMGRFGFPPSTDWSYAAETEAADVNPDDEMPVSHCLVVNSMTEDRPDGPVLFAHWSWPDAVLAEETVRALGTGWFAALTGLARAIG